MKILSCTLLIILLAVSVTASAISEKAVGIVNETRLLESELKLAKKPIIYFIFNLKDKKVFLKSRGLILKEMKIEDLKFWGEPVDVASRSMLKKSALFKEPKREKIDPNKNKEEEAETTTTTTTPGTFDIEALELKDMPATYRLEFEGGIFISIGSAGTGFFSKLYNAGSNLGWYISRPLITIWNSVRSRSYTSIYLTLNEEDARSIYWSLVENSENIIYQP